jgi:hypothetical protein
MKQLTTLFTLIVVLLASTFVAAGPSVINPIVATDKALEFGVWRVYNAGNAILLIDTEGSRYIELSSSLEYVQEVDKEFLLFESGESAMNSADSMFDVNVQNALIAESNGQLIDARYIFGNRVYLVNDDTLTIFDTNDEDSSGDITPRIVINRFSNRVEYTGTTTISVFDPTVSITPPGDDFSARLDVDGNGANDALTDGLLIIRYLFGLRGEALISGAIAPDATRDTAADIESFLRNL